MTVRPRTDFYLDAELFILMVVVVASGLVLWAVLPSGGEGNQPEGESRGRRWRPETTAGQPAEDLAPVPADDDDAEPSLPSAGRHGS